MSCRENKPISDRFRHNHDDDRRSRWRHGERDNNTRCGYRDTSSTAVSFDRKQILYWMSHNARWGNKTHQDNIFCCLLGRNKDEYITAFIATTHNQSINQSITWFVNGDINSKSVTTMIRRCRVAMVTKDALHTDVPSVGDLSPWQQSTTECKIRTALERRIPKNVKVTIQTHQ